MERVVEHLFLSVWYCSSHLPQAISNTITNNVKQIINDDARSFDPFKARQDRSKADTIRSAMPRDSFATKPERSVPVLRREDFITTPVSSSSSTDSILASLGSSSGGWTSSGGGTLAATSDMASPVCV